MLEAYSRFLDFLEKIERILLTSSMGMMSVIIVYQVILRYFFSRSNSWSEELARYLMIFSAMVGAAIAVRRNTHHQIDILINYFKPQIKRHFIIISTLVGTAFLVFLFICSVRLVGIGRSNMSAGINVSMAIPYTFIPAGVVLMILASLEVVFKNVDEIKHDKSREASR